MAVNPLLRSSQLRLIGLSSNMDTDSIVQQMLRIHQLKIDSQFRTRTSLQWKQESLRGVESQITDFRRSFLTAVGANAMRVSSAYNSTIATKTGINSGAVSVSTTINTPTGTLRIGQIESLAKATSISSVGNASAYGGFKLTDTLASMQISNGNVSFDSKGYANVNINGTQVTIHASDSLDKINENIRSKGGSEIRFYDSLTDYEGRRYAKVSINGKSLTVYEDEFYNGMGSISHTTPSGNFSFSALLETARVNINGTNYDLKDTPTGSDAAIAALNSNDGWAFVNINGVNVELNIGWPISDYSDLRSRVEAAFADAHATDASGNVTVNINGRNVELHEDDDFTAINEKFMEAGGADLITITGTVNINGVDVTLDPSNDNFETLFSTVSGSEGKVITAFNANLDPNSGLVDLTINGRLASGIDVANPVGGNIFNEINDKYIAAGGTAASSIRFDYAKANVNGVDVMVDTNINTSTTNIFDEINKQIRATDGGSNANTIKFDSAFGVSINGSNPIDISRNDTFLDINKKIIAADGNDTNVIKYDKYNGDLIEELDGGVPTGRYYTEVKADFGTGAGEQTFKVYIDNFQSSILESGMLQKANSIPKLKGFEYSLDANGNPRSDVPGIRYVTIGHGDPDPRYNTVIQITSDMTIEQMMQKINNSGAGVTMKYDRLSDRFTIENNDTGARDLVVGGFDMFGIPNGKATDIGSKARVQINGEWIERDTNTFDYNGVKITLNEVSVAEAGKEYEDTIVSFTRNADEPLEKIRNFIEAYNTLIKNLEDLLSETKSKDERSYKPLTDEEKSLMSDKQVEEWEAIAKKGLLRNDAGIQSLISSLRGMLFDKIGSAGMSPSELGLSTGRWDSGTGSQIVLDEDKLRAALEEDPDRVMNVFMGGVDSDKMSDKGMLWKMDDILLKYVNGNQANSLSHLENSIRRANEQMDKMQEKMWAEEDKLYKKFAAMETALSKLQSQTDWMTAMLGMNNNNNGK